MKTFIFSTFLITCPICLMASDPNAPDIHAAKRDFYVANPTLDAQKPYLEKARFYLEKHLQGHEIDPATSRPYIEEAYEAIKIARVMSGIKTALADKN